MEAEVAGREHAGLDPAHGADQHRLDVGRALAGAPRRSRARA